MMEQKNLILAIGLSLVVLFGSQFLITRLFPPPHPVVTTSTTATTTTGNTTSPGTAAVPAAPAAAAFKPRPEALAESPRVEIRSDSLLGSIALTGGRLDDLTLAKYRETVQKDSPLVVLLNPPGTPRCLLRRFRLARRQRQHRSSCPDANTRWTSDGTTLTPEHPVTLTWDNGQGLTLRPQVRGRPELHVHRHRFGEERRRHRGQALSLCPHPALRHAQDRRLLHPA